MAKETKKQELKKAQTARAVSPFEEMEQMLDQYFRGGWMRPWRFDWPGFRDVALPEINLPKVDVVDRESEVVVKAEVPGVDKKDLDVSASDDTLTIKGETSHEEKEEEGDYYRSEISRGTFSRTVALPASVDGSRAKVNFKDGILEVTLPKLTKTRRHTIKVD